MKLRFLLLVLTLLPVTLPAQPPPETGKPFVIEYYYKAKWGHADEFLQLFKKNHYPLLQKEVEMGRLLKVWIGPAPLPHHRRRALGLSRNHRVQKLDGRE